MSFEVGARVVATQALPEGVNAGAKGTIVGGAGWIQRRWLVAFDDGPRIAVPEYALAPPVRKRAIRRGRSRP